MEVRVVVVDEGEKENGRSCVLFVSFLLFFPFFVDFVWDGWWWLVDIGVRWMPLGLRKGRGVFCLIDTLITVVWSGVEWSVSISYHCQTSGRLVGCNRRDEKILAS